MSGAAMPMEDSGARRRYPRYQLSVPFDITVFRPSAVMRLSGQTQDLGEGGLGGLISGAALPGERVELTLVLPGSLAPLNMRAVIRHELNLYCGFEFLSLDHSQREQLQQLSADPGMQDRLINETEWEAGLEPPLHGGAAVCSFCGEEMPEEIPVCLRCGAPRSSPEAAEPAISPAAEIAASAQQPQPAKGKARRRFELDSLVAIVFLITLIVGLWQWLQAPADDTADSQPSAVTVALQDVFLRPAPAVTEPSDGVESKSKAALAATGSVISAIVGSVTPARVRTGGAASESFLRNRPRQEPSPSNSDSQNYRKAPESNAPPPTNPPISSPAPASSDAAAANDGNSGAPSGSQLAGMLLQKVLPVYPAQARQQGVQGEVVLKAVIGKDGSIAELSPLQGPQPLTSAAMDAVRQWRFRPYQLDGKPVEVETNIRVNFQLPKNK